MPVFDFPNSDEFAEEYTRMLIFQHIIDLNDYHVTPDEVDQYLHWCMQEYRKAFNTKHGGDRRE